MPELADIIATNLQRVRQRIAQAALRARRDPQSVRLVAVTKYAEWPWVQALVSLGETELGESRPQQLWERSQLGLGSSTRPVHWHLIGHLQRNKVRKTLPVTTLVHSVDSVRLLEDIDATAPSLLLRPRVLIEVNLSGESQKHGFSRAEVLAAWPRLLALKHVDITGLMTMAPLVYIPENARPAFATLRELRDELQSRSPDHSPLPELSMGMTHDFEVAIEEGATCVRIGSALWEGLPASDN